MKPILNWISNVFIHAPMHHLGDFLDHKDFAVFVITSNPMEKNLRNIIRARNEMLPVGKRMANLDGDFTVCKVYKILLQREGRYPLDIIATGGHVGGQLVNTVMSLNFLTMQCTTLLTMIEPRIQHAMVDLDGNLFVMGGVNNDNTSLSSVECLDLETGQWSEKAPMITPLCCH